MTVALLLIADTAGRTESCKGILTAYPLMYPAQLEAHSQSTGCHAGCGRLRRPYVRPGKRSQAAVVPRKTVHRSLISWASPCRGMAASAASVTQSSRAAGALE